MTEAIFIKGIGHLAGILNTMQDTRRKDLDSINAILGVDPRVLAPLYVEPKVQALNPASFDEEDSPAPIQEAFHSWANKFFFKPFKIHDGRHVAFILADAGMGKSCLTAMLKLTDVLRFFPRKTKTVLFRLGEGTLEQIDRISEASRTILLLDGIDEDTRAFGRVEDRLVELLHAATPFRQVVITGRTQFFPKENVYEKEGRIKIGGYSCPLIFLSPLDDDQVEEFLKLRFPDNVSEWRAGREPERRTDARAITRSMGSLRSRPMLLAHIEDFLGDGIEKWNEFNVHSKLVQEWLRREVRRVRGQRKFTEKQLLEVSHLIALGMSRRRMNSIAEPEMKRTVREAGLQFDITAMEFGGRSLLNRTSDGFHRFAHYSIQEFLVVDALVSEPKRHSKEQLESLHYSGEFVKFLSSWFREDLIQRLRGELSRRLSSSSATDWLSLSRQDLEGVSTLEGAHLSGVNLDGIDLRGMSLRMADLSGVSLRGANLRGTDLSEARLVSTTLQDAILDEAILAGADLTSADLSGASLRGAILSDTKLVRGIFRVTDFSDATMKDADLDQADLSEANYITAEQLAGVKNADTSKLPHYIDPLLSDFFEKHELFE